jgi:hypothetical protein
MAQPTGSRFIRFDPPTGLTELLGPGGYTNTGLGKVALQSLLPIYPSPALGRLAALERFISPRAERAGEDLSRLADEPCFSVVLFRNFTNKLLPPGLDVKAFVDFFEGLFISDSLEAKTDYKKEMQKILESKFYYVLAITASIWVPDQNALHYYIIAAATYMYDRLSGNYVQQYGVIDKGYPGNCTLIPSIFKDPSSEPTILTENASFNARCLGTFLLSTIQVLAGLHYEDPSVPESNIFDLTCNEPTELSDYSPPSHHLYLQSRVQRGSAYVMYIMLGFTTLALPGGEYHCTSYHEQCPVHKTKSNVPIAESYHTDDPLLRLLVLKHWIHNTWPSDPLLRTDVAAANLMWRQDDGLPSNHFLSTALIPPLTSNETNEATNVAYLKILNARCNTKTRPLMIEEHAEEIELVGMPVDRTLTATTHAACRMISSFDLKPTDIRCSMIRSLDVHVGSCQLDAFAAIAAPLYCEGKLYPEDEDGYSLQEMSLEIRLNLQAFYRRCTHYAFTDPCIEELASLAQKECQYAIDNQLVAQLGLSGFLPDIESLSENREGWSVNFSHLGMRLTMLDAVRGMKPAMWVDMQALQLLYSYQANAVLITPVYGVTLLKKRNDLLCVAPQAGRISSLRDFPVEHENPVFIVVPLLVVNITTFGFFTHQSDHAPLTRPQLCQKIIAHTQDEGANEKEYRRLPVLNVVGGRNGTVTDQYSPGHCASGKYCLQKHSEAATLDDNRCPGCGKAVHSRCGQLNSTAPNDADCLTCFQCYNKFGRPLAGSDDSDYQATSPTPFVPPPPESPVRNTRSQTTGAVIATPTSRALFPAQATTGRETKAQKEVRENQVLRETKLDSYNPAYMYPKDPPEHDPETWWLTPDEERIPDVHLTEDFMAQKETDSHTYSREEMLAWGDANVELLDAPLQHAKPPQEIFAAAYALEKYLLMCEAKHDPTKNPFWLHLPNKPLANQDLVNMACLLDRNRPFEIDTHNSTRLDLTLRVVSYPMMHDAKLKKYFGRRCKKAPKEEKLFLTVERYWLQKYLDWFDPELYKFITTHTDGMEVQRLRTLLAAETEEMYEQEGKIVKDKLLIPLPKMHKPASTQNSFGVTTDEGDYIPYSLNVSKTDPHLGQDVRQRTYDSTLTKSANPRNFEHVPVARLATSTVPDIFLQIKAVRADIQMVLKDGLEETTIRWLGLQGGRYVSLPSDWVRLNFDPKLLDEAQARATAAKPKEDDSNRFLIIPPGDSRDDDPPYSIRHSKGLNYYYQGQVDNCVMGGFADAVYWLLGPVQADDLLKFTSVKAEMFWGNFIKHVHSSLNEYRMHRMKRVDLLQDDDSMPMVVQLKALDGSESHAICIFDDCIFDSASRFVLKKNIHALDWCCSPYGFHKTLRVYQLKMWKPEPDQHKKKRSRFSKKK